MFHSADGFLTCFHPWGRESKFCGCRLAEISFKGEENLLAGWSEVNSKRLVQNKPQIFAEDADRNLSKPQPGGLFGTLRGFAPREARILHAAISTYHAQEMQKHKPRRGFSWITRIKSKHPTTKGTEEHGGTMQPQISQNTQIKELGPALFLSRTRRGFSRITRI
jgi:hypothetical protein